MGRRGAVMEAVTVRTPARAAQKLRRRDLLGEDGAVIVEFALLAPVLLLLLLGIAQFGLTLNQYIMLWNGVGLGAMQFAISGGASSTPYTSTVNLIQQSAPTLNTADLKITTTVDGTACTSDAACQAALQTNAGNPAEVSATYPCNLTIMGIDFFPSCTLTAEIIELVQ
jgi:Flp pilus assembly protein TadG